MKKEIKDLVDQKLHNFVAQENKSPKIFEKRWLDRYAYTEIHEIFFAYFSSELYKWITRLADNEGRCKLE